jgi:CO/xanthine dehydrogenase Mo-binding subunit
MAAIANALKEAVGVRFERLPMKPAVVLKAIQDKSA